MPLIHLPLSFSSGPGWPGWGRAQYCWSKMPMTCPEAVTAKAVCKCTPRASPPESIGPSSGMAAATR